MLAVVIHGYGGPEVIPGSLSEADIRVVVGNDARVKFMKPGRDAEVLVWKQLQILLLQNRNE